MRKKTASTDQLSRRTLRVCAFVILGFLVSSESFADNKWGSYTNIPVYVDTASFVNHIASVSSAAEAAFWVQYTFAEWRTSGPDFS